MIQLHHVTKRYPEAPALLDVTLRIEKGDFVFLHGPSGAGKSTLLKLLYREELPSDGLVLVEGRNLSNMGELEVPFYRRSVGVVFQDFRLVPDRTAEENVDLAVRVLGASPTERQIRVREALRMVSLEHRRRHYPRELSAGEQQRCAIARALAVRPTLLLADEPTGNLDRELAVEIVQLFKEANAIGCTVLIATHSEQLIERFARTVVRLVAGRLVEG
jgi:cell division transport system ATP-binding protein